MGGCEGTSGLCSVMIVLMPQRRTAICQALGCTGRIGVWSNGQAPISTMQ